MPTKHPAHKSARQKLQLSRLDYRQQELLGSDVDLAGFYIQLKNATGIQLIDRVMSADVQRTLDGASTLDVKIEDYNGSLMRSKLLHNRCDVRVDGLWFRLAKINRASGELTLTFEDREIAVLRTYNKPIKQSKATSRNNGVTRAEFILRLLREVKEFHIPYVIPDLHKNMPIEKDADQTDEEWRNHQRQYGITQWEDVTAKGQKLDNNQRQICNIILDTARSLMCPVPVMVGAIMCAIQESTIHNSGPGKPGDFNWRGPVDAANPVGVFQQIKIYGWPASRDVAKDAKAFLLRLKTQYAQHPSLPMYQLIENVQHSGYPRRYGLWHIEAQRIVAAYFGGDEKGSADLRKQLQAFLAQGGGGGENEYEFYRGNPETNGNQPPTWKPESSWHCIQRLAQEVNKMAFFVSGTFYYISQPELFKAKPRMILSEDSLGVDWIDFDWDIGMSEATCTISCDMDRWVAPPGSVIKLKNMGVVDGRWLVSSIDRSLYAKHGEITLIKPDPQLLEPGGSNIEDSQSSQQWSLKPQAGTGPSGPANPVAQKAVQIALKQLGDPYVWGAAGPEQFDCSGLVYYCYKNAGMSWITRTTAAGYYQMGRKLPVGQHTGLLPGDLLCFGRDPAHIHHIGIYLKGNQMIDAPHSGAVVRIENFLTWSDFYGASRLLPPTTGPDSPTHGR